jgi:alpha-glucosidase
VVGWPKRRRRKNALCDLYACDLAKSNFDNQSQPLLISSKGRFIWAEKPFKFSFSNRNLVLEASENLSLQVGGSTLKEVFQAAASRHFPSTGKMPDETFFNKPQWNTWIELGYNQNQESILQYARTDE